MKLKELVFYIHCGAELEITICGEMFFLQPDYDTANKKWDGNNPPYPNIVLYEVKDYNHPKEIFRGKVEDVIDYKFCEKYTLRKHLDKFAIIG